MNLLKVFLNWFWKLHKPAVLKNSKMKGLHAGETCLIFGNGGSLKYYDFSVLPDMPAMCTAYSLVDKRLANVDMRYWVVPDSYVLYPLVFNDTEKKIRQNYLLPILKKIASENPDTTLISSLTHFYSFFKKVRHVVYFHHFGKKQSLSSDLAGEFNSCSGSLDIMLGAARYFGFSKVILLGCDYLGSPKLEGHFYADREPSVGVDDPSYAARISQAAGNLDVLAIFPKGHESPVFKSATYGDYFGCTEKYQVNNEFIDAEYLSMMRKAAKAKQIYM